VAHQVVVEELRAVIAIEAKEGKGERLFDVTDLLEDGSFAASPDGALFAPSGGNINTINGIGELAGCELAAVSNSIGFEEAGVRLVPLVSGNGNLVTQEGSWLGGGTSSVLVTDTNWFKQSVNGGW
jgi:hypothetical protein